MSRSRHRRALAAVGSAVLAGVLVVSPVGPPAVAGDVGAGSRPGGPTTTESGGHWTEPVELTGTPDGYRPQLEWADIDAAGRKTVVWTAGPRAGQTIRARRSYPDGTWGAVQTVAGANFGQITVRAVTSSHHGSTAIVYSKRDLGLFARQWYADDTWSPEHAFGVSGTRVVADTGPDGRVAMLLSGRRTTFVRTPAGAWRSGTLRSRTQDASFDVAFGPGGSPLAVWTGLHSRRLLASAWSPTQGEWAEPESLGRRPLAFRVEADSNAAGDVVVAVSADADPGAHVVTTARLAGRSWRPLSPVTEPTNNAALDGVTVADDGSTLAGWYGRLDMEAPATLTAALGRGFGRSWSAPQTLATDISTTVFVDGDDAGTAVTGSTYSPSSTGARVAAVFRRAPGAGGFDDEIAVVPAGMDSTLLDLDVGPDGDILALAVGPGGHLWVRSYVTP